jgi:hypothetical protein
MYQQRIRSNILALAFFTILSACAEPMGINQKNTVTLPLLSAWYNGKVVYYITTDASEKTIAVTMGANLAPRLGDGLPEYPKPPEQKTLIEKVYEFTNNPQQKVFSAAPGPIGPTSADGNYSPIWLVILVTWKKDKLVHALTSEAEILDAEARGDVELKRTDILLNCPIVGSEDGARLPHVTLNYGPKQY